MLRFIVWIILIYIFAKLLGVLLQIVRPFFGTPRSPVSGVQMKKTKQQFDNVQDADFEDITDKK
ncbi:MAG: hypothetical protein WBZ48_06085 [Bacteroidota bacterium]